MRNIVYIDVSKRNVVQTEDHYTVVNSYKELLEKSGTFVMNPESIDVNEGSQDKHFLPAELVTKANEKLNVYFDLEQHSFFPKAKELIQTEQKSQGVLRFRRTMAAEEDERIVSSDLYVLASIFGDPEDVHVLRSREATIPKHLIYTVNFGNGTMAHLEYTFSHGERVEFEWSGVKKIIEFDSLEMNPFGISNNPHCSLTYDLNTILQFSHKADEELFSKLEKFRKQIGGGGAV